MELALYEDSPKYDMWFKLLLGFTPALTLILGLLLYSEVLPAETESEARAGGLALLGTAVFVLLLYWAVFPRKLLILEDRLKIKYGGFSLNFSFDTIKEVRSAEGAIFFGLNSATSFRSVIAIIRKKGMSVSISPNNRDLFLTELNKAMANWKRGQG